MIYPNNIYANPAANGTEAHQPLYAAVRSNRVPALGLASESRIYLAYLDNSQSPAPGMFSIDGYRAFAHIVDDWSQSFSLPEVLKRAADSNIIAFVGHGGGGGRVMYGERNMRFLTPLLWRAAPGRQLLQDRHVLFLGCKTAHDVADVCDADLLLYSAVAEGGALSATGYRADSFSMMDEMLLKAVRAYPEGFAIAGPSAPEEIKVLNDSMFCQGADPGLAVVVRAERSS